MPSGRPPAAPRNKPSGSAGSGASPGTKGKARTRQPRAGENGSPLPPGPTAAPLPDLGPSLPWPAVFRRPVVAPLLLLLAVLAVFWPILGFDFVNLDDDLNVYANVRVANPTLVNLLALWQAPYKGLYIPLTYSAWAGLAALGGAPAQAPPAGLFHAANLAVHGASTLAAFGVLRVLLGHPWAAFLGALLFALHPVQVEAVAWVTGLKDLLCGLFSLLALRQYLAFTGSGQPRQQALVWVLFILALLAKPGAVALPAALALAGWLWAGRDPNQLTRETGPLFLIAALATIATSLAQPPASGLAVPALWKRLFVAGDSLLFYARHLLWPHPLTPDLGRPLARVAGQALTFATGGGAMALATMAFLKADRLQRLAIGLFVVFLLPVLGFVPFHFQKISTVADRYAYLALLGAALGLGLAVRRWDGARVRAGVLALLAVLAGKSMTQVWTWQDAAVLNDSILAVNPNSWTAYINRGILRGAMGLYPAAADDFRAALALNPDDPDALANLGNALAPMGRHDEALAAYRKAVELRPDFAEAYSNLALLQAGRNENEAAVAAYRKAVELRPDFAEARSNLGAVYQKMGRLEEAQAMYRSAIALRPGFVEALANLGGLLLEMNRPAEAVDALKAAVAAAPGYAPAHANLAVAYRRLQRFDLVAEHERQARTLTAGPGRR